MTQSDDAKGRYRLAHTMIRVRDLDRTLAFYVGLLGMAVLRQTDYPDGRFTNTFIGYGPEATDTDSSACASGKSAPSVESLTIASSIVPPPMSWR